jgi:hypothetical protein
MMRHEIHEEMTLVGMKPSVQHYLNFESGTKLHFRECGFHLHTLI